MMHVEMYVTIGQSLPTPICNTSYMHDSGTSQITRTALGPYRVKLLIVR